MQIDKAKEISNENNMRDVIEWIFLGFLQGLCEFFPISSSGHLIVIQEFLKSDSAFLFTVILHFGTLCSVLFFYRKILISLLKTAFLTPKNNFLLKIIWASFPILIIGFFFYDMIKQFFKTQTAGWGFFFTGLLLLGTYFKKYPHKNLDVFNIQIFKNISYLQALVIGLSQVSALLPGVSRSGVSIATGIYFGLAPFTALHFSFLIGCVALFSACALELSRTQLNTLSLWPLIIGLISSFSFGYLALFLMKAWIPYLYRFSFYLLPLGLLIILVAH